MLVKEECYMSMIGKLRQVSEFELARFKKNPHEVVRALVGSQPDARELRHYFAELRNFYNDAARNGNAVLLWIS